MEGALLLGAQLQGANLDGVNLDGAWLGGAQLSGAKLDGADLKGAVFTDAEGLTWEQLSGAWNVERARLPVYLVEERAKQAEPGAIAPTEEPMVGAEGEET
jgi:hypothetical protein